jgi:isocitrate/isopropylmalate dehydrogenase
MLFLLNDVVLNVSPQALTPPMTARRFSALDFDAVRELGQELFTEHPMLQHTHPERAERLATLLLAKAARINAALFMAPSRNCHPAQVAVRFAEVDYLVLAQLHQRQADGKLTPAYTDSQVWHRAAA